MIILACDNNCGKQSPDREGRRIADSWITLTAQTQAARHKGDRPASVILCEDCWAETVEGTEVAFPLERLLTAPGNGGVR